MTKEVMVTLSGFQMAESEEDTVELVQAGEYYMRGGTHYIVFEEIVEGSAQTIKTMLKVKDRCLEVQKRGAVVTNMIFSEGKTQSGTYSVPYGSFLISIRTARVQIREEEERLEVTAAYGLSINGVHSADCNIKVKVEPKEKFQL